MEFYQPSAIVLQCGSDSLAGDKLGCFNLSMRGHANCVEFVKSFGLPLLLLGGGGYTMRNVSRAWAYETGLAAGQELSSQVPVNEYYEYFGPDYKLDVRPNNMEDLNTRDYLEKIKVQVFENLRRTAHAPSVQGHVAPSLPHDEEMENEDDEIREGDYAQDVRASKDQRRRDRRVQKNGELSDSEDEGEGGRRDRSSHGGSDGARNGTTTATARPSIMEPLIRRQEEDAAAGRVRQSRSPSTAAEQATQVANGANAANGSVEGPTSSSTHAVTTEPAAAPSGNASLAASTAEALSIPAETPSSQANEARPAEGSSSRDGDVEMS